MVKKFLRGINVSFLLLIIIFTFSSCANEMNVFEGNNDRQINFLVSVPEWKNTDSLATTKTSRAMPITDTSFGTDKSFNLIADQNDGAGNYSTLIDKESVSFTNNIWQTSPSHYYWLGGANKTINFYAYYPTSISGNISHTAGSSPTLLYTVPSDVSDQIDIISAINPNISGSTSTSTPLTFNHIFAAVKFAVGTSGLPSGTIKSITINGIKNSGTYTCGSGWTLGSTTSSFTVSPSTTINGTSGENIASDDFTLMMIPQAFNNATVSLVYNNGTTFSTTISGIWNAGGVYTYKLSKTIVFNYDYTGAVQTFTAPYTGTYKIECWGAGSANSGGYVKGYLKIVTNTILYIYVGQQGPSSGKSLSFNGGGLSTLGPNGSGATDIRLNSGDWNNFESLKSRLIVAGGGSGFGAGGGQAGGLIGYASTHPSYPECCGKGGGQTYGGAVPTFWSFGKSNGTAGSFGFGGNGGVSGDNISSGGGGGGGYYGGSGGSGASSGTFGGGGGSSFISGYPGCNAISASSTSDKIIHTGSPNHYSGYVFINSQMIAGNASMPSPTGGTEIGHTGNGYARITFVSAN